MRHLRGVLWASLALVVLAGGTAEGGTAAAGAPGSAYVAQGPVAQDPAPLTQIDVGPTGAGADGGGFDTTSLSADGRYVAFVSSADNLVPGDTNRRSDVFVRDTLLGSTVRVSVATGGHQANNDSEHPSISADGRYVAFASWASNLVPGDTNRLEDVFVRDLVRRTTTRVDVNSSGRQATGHADPLLHQFAFDPLVSANGKAVLFTSYANNLAPGPIRQHVGLYRHVLASGETALVDTDERGRQWVPAGPGQSLTKDGRLLAYPALPPGSSSAHLVIRDMVTQRMTYDVAGQNSASLSSDGRYLAFCTRYGQHVSAVYERDLYLHTVTLVSATPDGNWPNHDSCGTSISGDGRRVVFESSATDMTPNTDHNHNPDVYVWDRITGTVRLLTQRCTGAAADQGGTDGHISGDGTTVAVLARSSDLCGAVSHDHLEHYYVAEVGR